MSTIICHTTAKANTNCSKATAQGLENPGGTSAANRFDITSELPDCIYDTKEAQTTTVKKHETQSWEKSLGQRTSVNLLLFQMMLPLSFFYCY